MHAFLVTGKTQEERLDKAKGILEEYGAAEIIELSIPKTKYYIKDIRELNHKLSLKGGGWPRGVIIQDAHLLTTEAANSFLKTLEEPPGNTIIILTAPNSDLVLETIASRCQTVELGNGKWEMGKEEVKRAREIFEELVKGGAGERLKFSEATGTRQEALEFCIGQIYAVRKLLVDAASSTNFTKPTKDDILPALKGGVSPRRENIVSASIHPRFNRGFLEASNRGYTDTYGCIPPRELAALIDRIDQTRKDLEANVNVKLCLADLLLNYPKVSI